MPTLSPPRHPHRSSRFAIAGSRGLLGSLASPASLGPLGSLLCLGALLGACGAETDDPGTTAWDAAGGASTTVGTGGLVAIGGSGGTVSAGGAGATAGDGGMAGYPPYPEPAVEGLIRGVDPQFWANMDDFIFEVVRPSGVKLYVSLLTAAHYLAEEHRAFGLELFRRPESLFANAVIPFIERYESSGVLWAVDCMNEPEGFIAGPDGNYESIGLDWDEMRAWLAYCADAVHAAAPDLAVSAGSGWHDWDNVEAGRFDGLGFDFLDYHYYSDAPSPPTVVELGASVPVVIGECGQYTEAWDDALQYGATRDCFLGARDGGYLAALSWYHDYPGSENHLAHLNPDGSWRPVKSAFDELLAGGEIELGLNLAWLDGAYGHDFAPSALQPTWSVAYDHASAAEAVDRYAAAGIGIMRLWLFEGQEALPFHSLFDDFEEGLSGWIAGGSSTTLFTSASHLHDGDASVVVHFDASAVGWHGVHKLWSTDALLNLEGASEWSLFVANELGRDVGVNLAFVTNVDGTRTTYQTRAGTDGGQLWLGAGAEAEHAVSLSSADFAAKWALDTAPSVGVARPTDGRLAKVEELWIRVHAAAEALPLQGQLYLDAVRIR